MVGNQVSSNPRRLCDPETTRLLVTALQEYLQHCLDTGHLPKVAEVTRILIRQNLKWIMDENGRQRTMEKVRLELKNIKKKEQMIVTAATV